MDGGAGPRGYPVGLGHTPSGTHHPSPFTRGYQGIRVSGYQGIQATGNGKGGKGMERMREGIKWKGGERANFLKVALNK